MRKFVAVAAMLAMLSPAAATSAGAADALPSLNDLKLPGQTDTAPRTKPAQPPQQMQPARPGVLDQLQRQQLRQQDDEEEEAGLPELKIEVPPLPPINMVYVKSGCFFMGDATDEGDEDERPVHEVCLSDYQIQDCEVTQELFSAVMIWDVANNKKMLKRKIREKLVEFYKVKDPKKPVAYTDWFQTQVFIKVLNQMTNSYYRLPTEAEWEYAARGGGLDDMWSGSDNEAALGDYAWFKDNSADEVHNVKQKKPNELGLYDMTGNVWEWVEDYFDFDYYSVSRKKDPYGPLDITPWKVMRGGSITDAPNRIRNTYRYALEPARRGTNIGFRLAQ